MSTPQFLTFRDIVPGFILEHVNSGPDGAHVLVAAMGMRTSVSVDVDAMPANPAQDTPSQRLCRIVQHLRSAHTTDDEYDVLSRDLYQSILAAGRGAIMRTMLAQRTQPPSPYLADHLFFPISFLRMTDYGPHGLLVPTYRGNRYSPDEYAHAYPGADTLGFALDPSLPDYHVDEVQVLQTLVHRPSADHVACRVLVHGEEMFCKAERGGISFGDSVVGRDFQTMLDLNHALDEFMERDDGDDDDDEREMPIVRVPSLRGVIRHPDEGHVIGFLRDWVPGASLASYDMDDTAVDLRKDWDEKVASSLDEMHVLGVYWGAAENESIIIDPAGEPWLIDFGAKVNLGLKREEGDMAEGDWLDYHPIYDFLQLREEAVSDRSSVNSDESFVVVDTDRVMRNGNASEC